MSEPGQIGVGLLVLDEGEPDVQGSDIEEEGDGDVEEAEQNHQLAGSVDQAEICGHLDGSVPGPERVLLRRYLLSHSIFLYLGHNSRFFSRVGTETQEEPRTRTRAESR